MELRPIVMARMDDSVPPELKTEFESVTVHQLKALVSLPPEGLTMHELAGALAVTGATASALADRLVARRLVMRATDENDRRVVRLVPSLEGSALAGRWRSARRRMMEALLDRLSDEQVTAWLDVMETLAADIPASSAAELAGSPR